MFVYVFGNLNNGQSGTHRYLQCTVLVCCVAWQPGTKLHSKLYTTIPAVYAVKYLYFEIFYCCCVTVLLAGWLAGEMCKIVNKVSVLNNTNITAIKLQMSKQQ